ncbi:MAG: response regulator, partial [Comamonadaceae bacterium]
FELFAQGERTPDRQEGGLGIGLALVRRMVELHGGSVCAYSDGPKRGSAFEVLLPAAPALPSAADRDAPGAHGALAEGDLRVLVVDDNVDAGLALSLLLEDLGHEVRVETTARAALEAARESAPDVCLLDIGLPDADGRLLARQLRALPGLEGVALAAVSGYGQPEDIAATAALGMAHFVKPLDPEVLATWLAGVRVTRRRRPTTSAAG